MDDPVAQFLVAVAAVFLIGAVGEMVFERTFIQVHLFLFDPFSDVKRKIGDFIVRGGCSAVDTVIDCR